MTSSAHPQPTSASIAETNSVSDASILFEVQPDSPVPNSAIVVNPTECNLCHLPASEHDESIYKQIAVWVHGPKMDGATARQYTGNIAHEECIRLLKAGQAPDQERLF